MIGMIIVDDEPFMYTVLSNLIDYGKIGIEISGNASSGEEALEIITPDIKIAIVDIKMSGMSGMEFIDTASKKYPWLKFIVLSGYDDFSFVRKTFKLGAVDYFLKSELIPEEFEESLKRLADIISLENTILKDEDKLKKYIGHLIDGTEGNDCPAEAAAEFEKMTKRVMALKILDYNKLRSKENVSIEEIHKIIDDTVNEVISGKNILCTRRYSDEYILIIPTGIAHISGYELYERIVSGLNKKIYCVVNGGMSRKFERLDKIQETYNQAVKSAEYCYIAGNGKLLMYSSYDSLDGDIDVKKRIEKIRYYMTSMQLSELKEAIPRLFDVKGVSLKFIDKVRQLLDQSYYEIRLYITQNGVDSIDESDIENGKRLVNDGSVNDYAEWFIKLTEQIINAGNKYSAIVNRAIAYAHKHYSDPSLKLNKLAQNELFVTYNHISRVFRAETGMYFNQYLTDIRMKKALELLQSNEYKLYEIAEKIGYLNYENFSRTFKSYYGKSPKVFLKNTEE